jgi:hypothetical protein
MCKKKGKLTTETTEFTERMNSARNEPWFFSVGSADSVVPSVRKKLDHSTAGKNSRNTASR